MRHIPHFRAKKSNPQFTAYGHWNKKSQIRYTHISQERPIALARFCHFTGPTGSLKDELLDNNSLG